MRQTLFSSQSTPGQSPATKRKLKRRRLWLFAIIGAVVVLTSVIAGILATQGGQSSQPSSKVTQPATHPTQTAKSKPALLPQLPGPAILGANVGTFITKYGQPNSPPSNGVYEFAVYGNPHANDVTLATENNKVLGILEDSPNDQGWSQSEAIKSCLAFTPSDGIYKGQMTFTDTQDNPTNMERMYYSRSLAKQFPASDFTDENGDPTTPGMFGIVLTYSTGGVSTFLGCATQVGLNPNMIPGIM